MSGDALRFVAGMAVALAIGSAPSGPRPRDRDGDTPGLIVVVVVFALETLEAHPIEADRAQTWSKALPPDAYVGEDGAAGERPPAGWTDLLPHPLDSPVPGRFVQRWMRAPHADFLGVSFSALDLIGHSFGPDSHEVQDGLARLDRTIGTLLDYLDTRVGRGRYVLALTSDHGVAPVPEHLRARGTDAGRLSAIDIRDATEAALPEYLGAGPHVATVLGNEIYLRPGVWERLAPNRAARRALSAAVTRLPGVERLLHRDELARSTDGDRARRAAALSSFAGRSGDLVVVPRKHWVMTSDATTHGTHHDYDQRAPLVLFGAGIRPGRYADRVSPADIAPTFAALVGLAVTAVDGQPLSRALLPPGGARRRR